MQSKIPRRRMFPLISRPDSVIQRDYHTLFVKYRVVDIYLPFKRLYGNSVGLTGDDRMDMIMYYDICTFAIHEYMCYHVKTRHDKPTAEARVIAKELVTALFNNYEPNTFDVILHKALFHVIHETYYDTNCDDLKRDNYFSCELDRSEVIPNIHKFFDELTQSDSRARLHSLNALHSYKNNPKNTRHATIEYLTGSSHPINIGTYIADYVLLAESMNIHNWLYLRAFESVFDILHKYVLHYNRTICDHDRLIHHHDVFTNLDAHTVTVLPCHNNRAIDMMRWLRARNLVNPTDYRTTVLGYTEQAEHIPGNKKLTPYGIKCIQEYFHEIYGTTDVNNITTEYLETIEGRTVKMYELRSKMESVEFDYRHKYAKLYPKPEYNYMEYLAAEGYNVIRIPKTEHKLLVASILMTIEYTSLLDMLLVYNYILLHDARRLYLDNMNPVFKVLHSVHTGVLFLHSPNDFHLMSCFIANHELSLCIISLLKFMQAFYSKNFSDMLQLNRRIKMTHLLHDIQFHDSIYEPIDVFNYFERFGNIHNEPTRMYTPSFFRVSPMSPQCSKDVAAITKLLDKHVVGIISACDTIFGQPLSVDPKLNECWHTIIDEYHQARELDLLPNYDDDDTTREAVHISIDETRHNSASMNGSAYFADLRQVYNGIIRQETDAMVDAMVERAMNMINMEIQSTYSNESRAGDLRTEEDLVQIDQPVEEVIPWNDNTW